jgi:hypothetical protein
MAETDIEIIMDGSPEMDEAPEMMETEEMAMAGRNGDTVVGHLTEGEFVVPTEIFEGNPVLMDILFSRMREAGIEDPERYIVGSELNSINPETGMPEFFIGGIGKAIGGAFSAVGSALKAAAPYALPAALSFTPLGPIYGSALGTGIMQLVQGGDFKDALKSSLMSGGIGAFQAGLMSKFAGGTFGGGIQNALKSPATAALSSMVPKASAQGSFGSNVASAAAGQPAAVGPMGGFNPPAVGPLGGPLGGPLASAATPAVGPMGGFNPPAVGPLGGPLTSAATPAATATSALPGYTASVEPLPGTGAPESQGFFGKAKDFYSDYISPSRESIMPTAEEVRAKAEEYVNQGYNLPRALDIARKDLAPGLIQKYGPLAVLGTAGLYAGGFFKQPEVDQPKQLPTGAELLAQDPSRYRLSSEAFMPTRSAGSYYVPTKYYEDGGEVFPRRNGGIMPDEGIPNEDSVRAMLMPGEFVMTTDAVRGAGNGNLNRGISNMYSMMRNLENRNDRMA